MTEGEVDGAWSPRNVGITCGNGDGIHVTLICNGKRFVLSFPPTASLDLTKEGPILKRFEDTPLAEDQEEKDDAFYGVQDLVLDIGISTFARLAPAIGKGSPLPDLHSLLYPETVSFRFVTSTSNGKGELVVDEDHWDFNEPPPFQLDIENDLDLPIYSSKDIKILEIIPAEQVAKVQIDGQEMCFKCSDPSVWSKIEREFECLRTIAWSELPSSVRVPKLTGLVERADTGKLVGILEAFIAHDPEKPSTLQDLDISTISELQRKKWTTQIRETVDQLHEIGVVWGGGKPHNVLISGDTDDAWLIDFGRGSTDDWVDDQILETKESDEQAVEKIFGFLAV